MKSKIILLLALTASSVAFGQKFRPGYFINAAGDTTRTDIFLKSRGGLITNVELRDNSSFDPTQIAGMGVNDVHYISRKVEIDKSPKAGTVNETVFLEVISRAKIALLYYIDENEKAHYFIEHENGITEELGLKILDRGDGINFQELETYKFTLKRIFADCSDLTPVDKTKYTKKDILSVYEYLYRCKYGEQAKVNRTKDTSTDFGVTAGPSITRLKFKEDVSGPTLLTVLKFKPTLGYFGGLFIESRFARSGYYFSLRNELVFKHYSATSDSYSIGTTSAVGDVSANYLKYNLVLRTSFLTNRLKPFINAGLSPAAIVSYSGTSLITTNGSSHTEDNLIAGGASSFEFGFFGGAGLNYDNLGLEVRIERSSGLQPKQAYSADNTVYFMLSYILKKGK